MSYNRWIKATLEDHVDVIDCLHSKKPEPVDISEFIFLEVSNISRDGKLLLDDVKYISKDDYEKWISRKKPEIGDVIITKTGRVGEIAYIDTKKNIAIGRNQVLIHPHSTIHPLFLKYYFFGPEYKNSLKSLTMTGTILESLHVKYIPKLSITLPLIQEQTAIANILSSLDEKIELNNKINKNLEEMAQALYKQWFVDFEFPNEDGEPYKSSGGEMIESELGFIPKGWEVKSLYDLTSIIRDGTHNPPKRIEMGVPLLTGVLFDEGVINYNKATYISEDNYYKIHKNYQPEVGDIVLTKIGTLGKVAYLRDCDIPIAIHCNSALLRPNFDMIDSSFLYFYLRNKFFKDQMDMRTGRTAQPFINLKQLGQIKAIIPKTGLIKKELFTSLLENIFLCKTESNILAETRDTLLPKLMSGELELSIEG